MRTSYIYRIAIFCAGLGLVSGAASAGSFSFTGTFNTDDELHVFSFVAGPGSAILRTWGYAGGTNANGQLIAPGGFDPVLSLFGPDSTLQASTPLEVTNNDGAPGTVPQDPTTFAAFDSFIDTATAILNTPLIAGQTYFLVLTENDNVPFGPSSTFGDGFSEQGLGDFTGPNFGCGAGPFCDQTVNQRNGDWAVDITGVNSAQDLNATPEPGSLWLAGCAMAVIVAVRRRKVSSVGQPG